MATITNLTQYKLSQEEPNLLKASLYFSIQPDKIQKSEILTTFEKIHCLFLNNPKSEVTEESDKSASLISCEFLLLQLQTFSRYTTSTSHLTKP